MQAKVLLERLSAAENSRFSEKTLHLQNVSSFHFVTFRLALLEWYCLLRSFFRGHSLNSRLDFFTHHMFGWNIQVSN